MGEAANNLFEVLLYAAHSSVDNGVTVYRPGQADQPPDRILYTKLLQDALSNSKPLRNLLDVQSRTVILLHLDDHVSNITWLWSVIAAGYVPAISTPFPNDMEQRRKHLSHLQELLQKPLIITKEQLLPQFAGFHEKLNIHTIESLEKMDRNLSPTRLQQRYSKRDDDLAILMLTSGSTGNAKAVRLNHGQIISAITGKTRYHNTTKDDVFLNWIGMDHVANLTEIHLHAMYLGADQVHVHAADLLASPLQFLRLIDRHRASYSFAPNFFLASCGKALEVSEKSQSEKSLDLSSIRCLISGGESNSTALCNSLTLLMQKFGAPDHFIRPGFGMTETCAGSIYGTQCPSYDVARNLEFASVGSCIPGMSMRIAKADGSVATAGEAGNLEVSGRVVFKGYFNNQKATESAFTPDGWFATGDKVYIDSEGKLIIVGREKETIIINGVKYFPQEIEKAIEDAEIDGVSPSYTAVFPCRPTGAETEALCIVYLPSYSSDDVASRVHTGNRIRNVVMTHCMVRAYKVIPLEKSFLPKSSLGKLSRAKIRKAFESGAYDRLMELDDTVLARWRLTELVQPTTGTESLLHGLFVEVFQLKPSEIGIDTNLYDMGCSSVEIFRLKTLIQSKMDLAKNIPITTIIANPTVRTLTTALDQLTTPKPYNPVVVLRYSGSKTPLWLIHPGVGEVLIFLKLVKYITDRPVYALRARGFDGEDFFRSIPQIVSTYHRAIKQTQQRGPYAIAGYSYGGTLAFEIAKLLQARGDEVQFLAVFDQPPNIKRRMRQGDWIDVLFTLTRFFNLLAPDAEATVSRHLRTGSDDDAAMSKDMAVDFLLSQIPSSRLEEFGLDKLRMRTWASLAYNMHVIARDYEPSGEIPHMEIFYAEPISAVAKDKVEWMKCHLSRWNEFVDKPVFNEVDGSHYTLIGPENVASFWKKFKARLEAAGL